MRVDIEKLKGEFACFFGSHDFSLKKVHKQFPNLDTGMWAYHGHRCQRPGCKVFYANLFAEDCAVCLEEPKRKGAKDAEA